MPVGVIDSRYLAQIARLKQAAGLDSAETLVLTQRSWFMPDPNGSLYDGNPRSLEAIKYAFDRTALGLNYLQALLDVKGAGGDAMSDKVQSDYLAALERAYRLRHMGFPRTALHAAARRSGHAATVGGVFDRVTQYASDLLVAGAAGFVPAEDNVNATVAVLAAAYNP